MTDTMEDRAIRSRRSIHPNSPSQRSPGSPIRRKARHLSPTLSGSEDDEGELELESYPDESASSVSTTLNSSLDAADGGSVEYSIYKETQKRSIKFFPNGNIREPNETSRKQKIDANKKEKSSNNGLWLCVFIALTAVSCFFLYSMYHRDVATETRHDIRCSFERSAREFPKQNTILWRSLKHGVESVLNNIPTSPSIFLLAYDDVKSVNRITRSIVQTTTECMNSKVNALELSPADLAYDEMKSDYGVVITKYQNQLRKSGVMLVNDLNKIPSEVVPAFHSFCDVHNPLVDRSIIFLTVQLTGQIYSDSNVNALQLVENYLRSNWSSLEANILEPLITRVTDQVFLLNRE